jgi:collagenase-like PrtC family protease
MIRGNDMKLSVGTNFDDQLPVLLKNSNVEVFYGKMSSDLIGGGRPTFALSPVDKKRVEEHVKVIHQHGFKFNYLLNATCMDNLETTREYNLKIRELLEWLGEMKVDYITVTVPMLIDLIRKTLPKTKISLSTFANVSSVKQAKIYEEMGVSEITLPENKNRDFRFLENIRKATNCQLQLIATNDCLLFCPWRGHHANFQSHASQSDHVSEGFAFDYCMLRCTQWKAQHPEELLKSPWIRPEDLTLYRDLGYEKIKLTERMKKTSRIVETAGAYCEGHYDGNLLQLLNTRLNESDFQAPDFALNDKDKFIHSDKMSDTYQLIFGLQAVIPNKKLNGFVEGLKDKNCQLLDCDQCRYCKSWAEKVVEIKENNKELLTKFDKVFDDLSSGALFDKRSKELESILWTEESIHFLDQMIDLKPEFIRSTAKQSIKKKAEEIALKANQHYVLAVDVARGNLECTPDDFKFMARQDLKKLGFDVDALTK